MDSDLGGGLCCNAVGMGEHLEAVVARDCDEDDAGCFRKGRPI
jgi:hypothetical protein